jgi:hypothetical protein
MFHLPISAVIEQSPSWAGYRRTMRHFLQTQVLVQASLAALATAAAGYPRLSLWSTRAAPVWYLEAVLFVCSIILWGFVFAWHTRYSDRPVFVSKLEIRAVVAATFTALIMGLFYYLWLDPVLRLKWPSQYPADPTHWLALTLFSLAFNQLCLTFAPYAWLMRLFKRRRVATTLTVLFGVGLLGLKIQSLTTPVPFLTLAALLAGRLVIGLLAVTFFLRGGVMLAWWWTLVFEARLLLGPVSQP